MLNMYFPDINLRDGRTGYVDGGTAGKEEAVENTNTRFALPPTPGATLAHRQTAYNRACHHHRAVFYLVRKNGHPSWSTCTKMGFLG